MNKSWSSPQEQSIFPLLIIMCNFHIFRRTWPQHPFYYMPQYTHSVLLSGWNAIIKDDGLISPSCSTALLFIISFFHTFVRSCSISCLLPRHANTPRSSTSAQTMVHAWVPGRSWLRPGSA